MGLGVACSNSDRQDGLSTESKYTPFRIAARIHHILAWVMVVGGHGCQLPRLISQYYLELKWLAYKRQTHSNASATSLSCHAYLKGGAQHCSCRGSLQLLPLFNLLHTTMQTSAQHAGIAGVAANTQSKVQNAGPHVDTQTPLELRFTCAQAWLQLDCTSEMPTLCMTARGHPRSRIRTSRTSYMLRARSAQQGEAERTPSAVEPSVEPEASPNEVSPRWQPSMTSNAAPVSATTVARTSVLKQSPSRNASAIACTHPTRNNSACHLIRCNCTSGNPTCVRRSNCADSVRCEGRRHARCMSPGGGAHTGRTGCETLCVTVLSLKGPRWPRQCEQDSFEYRDSEKCCRPACGSATAHHSAADACAPNAAMPSRAARIGQMTGGTFRDERHAGDPAGDPAGVPL